MTIPLGECQCGCGGRTNLRKGHPNLFLKGHFAKGKPGKSGAENPNWKGGRRTNDQGYVLIRDRDHMLCHVRLRAYLTCGNANWLKCPYCKEYDDPENLHINGRAHYHTSCQTEYERKRREKNAKGKSGGNATIHAPSFFGI
jgi:hypothetical protein